MGIGERGPGPTLIGPPRLGRVDPQVGSAMSLRSEWISSAIQPALERSTAGRVLHVFPSAAYVVNQGGDVVALVRGDVGPGPLSIVLAGTRRSLLELLRPGEPVWFVPGEMRTDRIRLRLDGRPWQARPAWEAIRSPSIPVAGFLGVRDALSRLAPAGSLAALLNPIQAKEAPLVGEIRRRSGPFLSALVRCIRQPGPAEDGAVDDLRWTTAALAGLGAGFTPAGDDFLLGAIYSVWARATEASAQGLADVIAEAAAPRTTTVSGAYLRAGAAGGAGPGWHRLIAALEAGDQAAMSSSVSRLCRIGHTSGADALTGYVLSLGVSTDGA